MTCFYSFTFAYLLSGQLAPIGPGEFKKPVYDSKFTKLREGMSFVN